MNQAPHLWLLIAGIALLLSSLFAFTFRKKAWLYLSLLFAGALLLRLFFAHIVPYLTLWDEQYHALAAKNMMLHPLTPTLYDDPVLPYNPANWVANHIWVHKQPLFLWQIMISYELFGTNEFAVRLPSALLSALVTLCIYRMGIIIVNARTGFLAAWLYALLNFVLELVAGVHPTDHNDLVFHCYVAASLWAFTEYGSRRTMRWALLAGLFAGMAMLVKWLPGLLVYSGWGVWILFDSTQRTSLRAWKHIAFSFITAMIVFLPWQLYTLSKFPHEVALTMKLNTNHFTEVLEGHGGDALFYFHNLRTLYGGGQLVPFIMIAAMVWLIYRIREKAYRIAFATFVILVYAFYTMAATKMIAFTVIVSPVLIIALAHGVDSLLDLAARYIRHQAALRSLVLIICIAIGYMMFDLNQVEGRHFVYNNRPHAFDHKRYRDTGIMKALAGRLDDRTVIFNCKPLEAVPFMFYTGYTAYEHVPSEDDIDLLKKKSYPVAVFDNGRLPEHLLKDKEIKVLDMDYYTEEETTTK